MDKNYWEKVYAKQAEVSKPSLFALHVAESIGVTRKRLIELGCGNGRDSIFFANENSVVTAVDQSINSIRFLKNRFVKLTNIKFFCRDFTALDNNEKYDIVYSRFTLHSISAEQEENVLSWAHFNLDTNGKFCIEVRGKENEIYGIGQSVENEPDAFIFDDHFRRFIDFKKLCNKLETMGFYLHYADEKKGFAPYNGEDETYIRIIATKK